MIQTSAKFQAVTVSLGKGNLAGIDQAGGQIKLAGISLVITAFVSKLMEEYGRFLQHFVANLDVEQQR